MTIAILNGPNLNLVGRREPEIYGQKSFDEFLPELRERFPQLDLVYLQSNHEGDLIDWLQDYGYRSSCLGIVLNAGGYTHTSVAIRDAVAAIPVPVAEVHISAIQERESFRHFSYLTDVCRYHFIGHGLDGYRMAIEAFLNQS